MGGGRSKWLREEGDGDWGRQEGRDNHGAANQGFQNTEITRRTDDVRFQRNNVTGLADNSGYPAGQSNHMQSKEGNPNKGFNNGLDSEELYGLNLEERKRQRSEAHYTTTQTQQTDVSTKASTLSTADCVETSTIVLAKLAEQASQLQ